MKRAEQFAWIALSGLLLVCAILLTGAIYYRHTEFWAGAMLTGGQALAVGLAAWGLMLARQYQELRELPPLPGEKRETPSAFRMSVSEEHGRQSPAAGDQAASTTLETSFQRLLVFATGFVLVALAGVLVWMLRGNYQWLTLNPGKSLPITWSSDPKTVIRFDEPAPLLLGLCSAALYGVMYWFARKDADADGEPVASNFMLGIVAMAGLAVGTVLSFFGVAGVSEIVTGLIAALLALQGLEYMVNSARNYTAIEEMDQDVIDLEATPLGPMLSSVWLGGLRLLFAQSVGLDGKCRGERGVVARMMPRVLIACIIIAIAVSCIRIVPPGKVAVLERLGNAPMEPAKAEGALRLLKPSAILQPGLHFCYPWPIDQLVMIPTQQMQTTTVGTELHAAPQWGKGVDFQFWTVRADANDDDIEDLFVTGDPSPQILETYVLVQWHVDRPELFYSLISHSEFFEGAKGGEARATYEAIIQQCTSFAVTRTFAIHSLEQIMFADQAEVERHCKEILQKKLDSLGRALGMANSGISIDYLLIKDLHPPYWRPDRRDATEPPIGGQPSVTDSGIDIQETADSRKKRGPASAFEFVISMSEFQKALVSLAEGDRAARVEEAKGFAQGEILSAQAYAADKVARAHGEADRLVAITQNLTPEEQQYKLKLMKQRLLYATLQESLDQVTKIVTDPDVKNVNIWQSSDRGTGPVAPGQVVPGR